MSAIFGTYYNIDKDGGSGGDILTFEAEESYMGRVARQLDDAVVTGDSEDECTIHVSQQGHEFVEFDENLNNFALTAIPYDETYASFDIISNSKYLSFVMDNEDPIKPHYSIGVLIVDEDLDGTYTDTYQLDANNTIEIVGDPGQNDYYRVRMRIDFYANDSSSDISGSLTVTGWSGSGSSKTLEVKLKHLHVVNIVHT